MTEGGLYDTSNLLNYYVVRTSYYGPHMFGDLLVNNYDFRKRFLTYYIVSVVNILCSNKMTSVSYFSDCLILSLL